MSSERVVLGSRDASTMVSSWTEYLCVRTLGPGRAILEVCMYEAFAQFEGCDDDGNELDVPETYEGKQVVGIEDGYLVGGELMLIEDMETLTFSRDDFDQASRWVAAQNFEVSAAVLAGMQSALNAGH